MAGLNLPTYLTLSMPSPPCHFLLNRKISGTNNCHFSNISKIFPPIKLPAGTESKNPIFLGALGRHSHWFRSRCCFELQFLDCRLEGKKVAWLACPSSFHFESDQSRWFYFFFFLLAAASARIFSCVTCPPFSSSLFRPMEIPEDFLGVAAAAGWAASKSHFPSY